MLAIREDLVLIDSSHQPAGACAACGQPIGAGEGLTALYGERLLRFRCSGCLFDGLGHATEVAYADPDLALVHREEHVSLGLAAPERALRTL